HPPPGTKQNPTLAVKSDQNRLASSRRRTTPNYFGTAYLRVTKLIGLHRPARGNRVFCPKCRGRPPRPPPNLRLLSIRLRFVVNRDGLERFAFAVRSGRVHGAA